MQVIDLSKNSFSDKSGIALGPVLAANDYLEELDLSWNMIRGTGAVAMAKGLKVYLFTQPTAGRCLVSHNII